MAKPASIQRASRFSRSVWRSSFAHITGVKDSASTLEKTTAAAIVTASSLKITPMLSVRNMIGVNTATSTAVVAITAKPTCREPL